MSTDTVYAWSTTADSNDTADAEIDWREYQATATVNNSARAMMRRVAQVLDDLAPNVTSTGSVNTYAVSSSSTGGGASLNDGEIIEFIPHITNTTACTLARDSKGAVPWRPKSGTEFGAGDIVAGVPVKATYRLASNEWLSSTPGYVFRTTAASYLTSHTFGLRVGDVKLSLASAPDDGFIRLTETTQALVKADYPDLDAWASGQGYPWGSTSTTFNVPPAGGYFLRFAASNATVDPDGARSAGVTQDDAFESHTHTATVTDPGHDHTYQTGNHANACAYTSQGFVDDKTMTSAQTTSSTTGVTVANSLTGGVETRGKNVAMHADMLANPALVAVSLIGANGLAYRYSTVTTATNPGSGYFSLNNATVGSATSLYISETDANGSNLSAVLAALPANTQLYLTKVGAPATFMSFVISSTQTDNGDWDTFPLSGPTSSGSFANGDMVSVSIMRPGPAGPSGSGSGDVVGPASGTDNAFARFDGATGKIIQNSTATLSDTGVAAGMKIIPTGASTARTLEARAADVINVKDFGAAGDGMTDDTSAISAAYTAAEAAGGLEVFWPAGEYKTTGTITCGPLSSTRAAGGAVLTYTGSGTAFEVQGVNTSETNGQFHVLPYINRTALGWNSGSDTTSIGLLLADRKYNTFVIPGVKRFNTGVALKADAANFVCNTLQLGVIQNNRLGIDFSRVTLGKGINQNTFIGGAVVIDSAYTSAANRIHINMPDALENNTNTFVGLNLEKGGNEKAIICASSSNIFLNCRFEGSSSTAGYITVSGNNNHFVGGSPTSSATIPFVTWISDTGSGNTWQMANVFANKYFVWDTHSGSKPLRFGNGSAYPATPIGPYGVDRLSLGDSSTVGVRYNGYMLQEEVVTTSGTTIPGKQHQTLNYAAPATIPNITGGFGQDLGGIFTLVDINGNITLAHTAAPSAGGGRFVLKAGVDLAMTANLPVLFVLRDGNLYQI